MSFYHQVITQATGITDPEDLADIEDCMRNDIFHSTLDWQTADQLKAAAVEAWEIVRILRDPAMLESIMASMRGDIAPELRA